MITFVVAFFVAVAGFATNLSVAFGAKPQQVLESHVTKPQEKMSLLLLARASVVWGVVSAKAAMQHALSNAAGAAMDFGARSPSTSASSS